MSRGAGAVNERTSTTTPSPSSAPPADASARAGAPEWRDTVDRVTVIRPATRWPRLEIPELWHFRELLWTLVWRDVVVRYKQTFLGIAWAILVPAFTALVYIVVFGKFANFPDGGLHYAVLVVGGVLPMQYFVSSLTSSSMSLANNLQLVTKVYFPRVLLPLAAVLVPMVDLIVGMPVLVAVMWIYESWPGGWEVLAAPAFLALALVAALGAGFFLSALNVRYRDVRYVIPVLLPVLPLVSGVIYAVQDLPTKWQWVLAFNPMTAVVSGWRWAVLDAVPPDWAQVSLGAAVALAMFLVGLTVFRATEPKFADTI
jgi:lipopolysaccharide transport system permease protein